MNGRLLVFALLIIGLGASIYTGVQRIYVESENKAVEIVLDYDEVLQMAAATGKTPVEVMKQFQKAGATSVAITEETVADLIQDGLLTPLGARRYQTTYQQADRVLRNLGQNFPHRDFGRLAFTWDYRDQLTQISLPMDPGYLSTLPVGLSSEAIRQTLAAGLIPVARLVNFPGATPRAINTKLADVKSKGIDTVIFSGDQVLGYRGAINSTSAAVKENRLAVGWVEFSKQKGDRKLAEKSADSLVVVHSISTEEMTKLTRTGVVDRFQKAVRERGARLLYVRMFQMTSGNIMRDNTDYIAAIAGSIEQAGYTRKEVHPTREVKSGSALRALSAAGVAAGAVLLLLSLVRLSPAATALCTLGLVLVCAGLAGSAEIGRKAVALLSAMVFPTLAVVNALKSTPETPTNAGFIATRTLGRFLMAVLTVSVGGMLIVGLLSDRSFMLRVDQFIGVKLAHLAPVLILAAIYAGGVAWKSGTWAEQKQVLMSRVREVASNPILIWQAAAAVAMLMVVGLMVARSGNDSGLGISALELRFRSFLDQVLYVRPRTKEFLIGYPALILGIAFALRGMRQWAAPLVVLGSIGLVSALNTFCHIHTPVTLSLMRVVNGAIVGGLFGLVLMMLVMPRRRK